MYEQNLLSESEKNIFTLQDFSEKIQNIICDQLTAFNYIHLDCQFESEINSHITPNLIKYFRVCNDEIQFNYQKQICGEYFYSVTPITLENFLGLMTYDGENDFVLYAASIASNVLGCENKRLTLTDFTSILEGFIAYYTEMFLNLFLLFRCDDGKQQLQEVFNNLLKVKSQNKLFLEGKNEVINVLKQSGLFSQKLIMNQNNTDYWFPIFMKLIRLNAIVYANRVSLDGKTVLGLEA